MVEIPENTFDRGVIAEWYKAAHELKVLKAKESLLRKKVFSNLFPDPKEGTNNYDLGDGFKVVAMYPYTREIDEGAFEAIKETLRQNNINPDNLVKTKPELKKAEYNKLTDVKKVLFDQCLIVKPGSISLSILPTAKKETE